ncbi:hypothetical protein BFJ72_g2945 [Fusarium proliferatum]|uniref:CCHC-type domain-containing protein n=1 Tax=Gibberella intermedia TaxID=948311 RepID=A0A420TWX2_GIBIN|nr:hypothetical protein BFJ72_g2945 [Fusarium proliferatum]
MLTFGRANANESADVDQKCFKCDQTGHIVKGCEGPWCGTSKENTHTFEDCPLFICRGRGEQGHMKRDCPEVKCNNCYEFGHLPGHCGRLKCWRCGELDHFAQDYTNKQTCGTCQGPHATVLCHVNKQEPDKKKQNVSSAGGFIPVAKNHNRIVTKQLPAEKQNVVDLRSSTCKVLLQLQTLRHLAGLLNAFVLEAHKTECQMHRAGWTHCSRWNTKARRIRDFCVQRHQAPSINAFRNQAFDAQQSHHDQSNDGDNGGSSWGTDQPVFDGW